MSFGKSASVPASRSNYASRRSIAIAERPHKFSRPKHLASFVNDSDVPDSLTNNSTAVAISSLRVRFSALNETCPVTSGPANTTNAMRHYITRIRPSDWTLDGKAC
jgi:hypothetical protein